MRQRINTAILTAAMVPLVALAACSEAEQSPSDEMATAGAASTDMAGEQASDAPTANTSVATEATADSEAVATSIALPDLGELPVSLPKLAYVYDYSWRLPAEDIGTLQRRHADLCEQQGPASCQILGMRKSGEEADEVTGELQLAVATSHARAFGALLEKEAGSNGAEQLSAEIAAEELSKQIVDTEARLRARTELRDRLMEVLRTRRGKVEELVEAERSVAAVNEEIDQAKSWLTEMKGRVAYSRVNLRYESGTPVSGDFLSPVAGAVGSLGTIFGWMLAVLIVLGAVLAPVAGIVWAGRAINRRMNPEVRT